MSKNKMAIAALGLGAAFLLRNRNSRDKLMKQFENFTNTPIRGRNPENSSENTTP